MKNVPYPTLAANPQLRLFIQVLATRIPRSTVSTDYNETQYEPPTRFPLRLHGGQVVFPAFPVSEVNSCPLRLRQGGKSLI